MSVKQRGVPIEILLVEDSPGDIRLTLEVFKDSKISNNISVVEDGVEAINFLRRQGKHAGAVRPDLVLLDLNLPKKSGSEVLEEIKEDPDLKHIPVVVLTVSDAEEDILKCYRLLTNCFITKPVDLEQFIKIVKSIEDFWFCIVKLPPKGG